jgi:predicted  nucleic acid-binding Zn-ribbon protein
LQNEISDMRDWLKSEISELKNEISDMKECVEGIGERLKEEVESNLEEVLYLLRKGLM